MSPILIIPEKNETIFLVKQCHTYLHKSSVILEAQRKILNCLMLQNQASRGVPVKYVLTGISYQASLRAAKHSEKEISSL